MQFFIFCMCMFLIFRWSDVVLINEMFNNPAAERLAVAATMSLVAHQIISAIWIYLDEYGSLASIKNMLILIFRCDKRSVAIIQHSDIC